MASARSMRTAGGARRRWCTAVNSRTARASLSSNTTSAAPRDAASRPRAPEPANASSTRQPDRSWPSQLKSVSRTQSGVGRSPGRASTRNRVRFQVPAMMRTSPGLCTSTACGALATRGVRFFTSAPRCPVGPSVPWLGPPCIHRNERCWLPARHQRRPPVCHLPGAASCPHHPRR